MSVPLGIWLACARQRKGNGVIEFASPNHHRNDREGVPNFRAPFGVSRDPARTYNRKIEIDCITGHEINQKEKHFRRERDFFFLKKIKKSLRVKSSSYMYVSWGHGVYAVEVSSDGEGPAEVCVRESEQGREEEKRS